MTMARSIRIGSLAIGLIGILGAFVPADAAVIIYSGMDVGASSGDPRPLSDAAAASYDAAAAALVGTTTLVDFESAPVGPIGGSLVIAPGVSISSAEGTASIYDMPVGTPDRLYGFNTTAGGSNFAGLIGGSLTFTFAQGVQAFGAYITGVQLDSETLTFDDGSSQTIVLPNPGFGNGGAQFIGFTDAGKSIVSITYTANANNVGDIVGVDDVRWVTSAVPEPSALSLIAVGLAAVAAGLRLRRPAA